MALGVFLMLAFFYRVSILFVMSDHREKISADRAGRIADALEVLRAEGATGEIAVRGFLFRVEETSDQEGKSVFSSPYVRTLGEREGLPGDTQVITREDFVSFVNNTYGKEAVEGGLMPKALDIVASVFPGGRFSTSDELKNQNLNWFVHFQPEGKRTTETGINPHAVVATFSGYENDEALQRAVTFQPIQTRIWLNLSRHLRQSMIELPQPPA